MGPSATAVAVAAAFIANTEMKGGRGFIETQGLCQRCQFVFLARTALVMLVRWLFLAAAPLLASHLEKEGRARRKRGGCPFGMLRSVRGLFEGSQLIGHGVHRSVNAAVLPELRQLRSFPGAVAVLWYLVATSCVAAVVAYHRQSKALGAAGEALLAACECITGTLRSCCCCHC